MANIPGLLAVLDRVEDEAKNGGGWDQTEWRSRCDTSRCFAGWAVTVAGAEWASDSITSNDFQLVKVGNSDPVHVSQFAREYLELDYDTAEDLFEATNSLETIRSMVQDVVRVEKARERVDSDLMSLYG